MLPSARNTLGSLASQRGRLLLPSWRPATATRDPVRSRPDCALLLLAATLPPSSYSVSTPLFPPHPTPGLHVPHLFPSDPPLSSPSPLPNSLAAPSSFVVSRLPFLLSQGSSLIYFTAILLYLLSAPGPLPPPLSCSNLTFLVPSPCFVPLSCFPPALSPPALGLWLSHAVAMESPKAAGRLALAALRPRRTEQ